MNQIEIEKKVRDVLDDSHVIKIPLEQVENKDHFINDLDVDSVGMITVLTALEKAFGIEIPPTDFSLENFANIERMVSYVQDKVKE